MIDQNILAKCERRDEDKMSTAQKVAENMTGKPAPQFESPEERHRVVMENAIVTLIRYMQAVKLVLDEISEKLGGEDRAE